jgi:alcohol dehydrogenase (cytochrome c)
MPSDLIRYLILAGIITLFFGIVSTVSAQESTSSGLLQEDQGRVPPDAAEYSSDWPLPNKDYANTRNQQDTEISSSTIRKLNVSWTYQVNGHSAFGSASTNPLILNETVIFQDLAGNIATLRLTDGGLIWSRFYNSTSILGPNGPAVGYGKTFISPDGYSVTAFNSSDGSQLWSTRISPSNSTGINIQPIVYNHRLFLSTVPGTSANDFYAGGQYGEIYAVDTENGAIIWNTSTVDTPDLWGNRTINSGGGAWYTPAIDTRTGITFWGIGNPAPFPGTKEYPAGSSRPGPNLYTDSIMAINGSSGEIVWYNQVKPHDLFDLDFQIPPILATIPENGTGSPEREVVFGAGKLGRVYAFDRIDGTVLWSTLVGIHNGNEDLMTIPENGVIQVIPGFFGGVETPMAYGDGILCVPVVNFASNFTATGVDPSSYDFSTGTGELVALDASSGKILWDKEYPSMNLGGATIARDVVLTATSDGTIYAYLLGTGEELIRLSAPSGINGWPAVGKDSIIWPAGATRNPQLISLKISP